MQFTAGPPTGAWTTGAPVVHSQSDLATVFVRVPVQLTEDGAAVNLSAATMKLAFLADLGPAQIVLPGVADWKTATVDTDASTVPATYAAQVLVGPGGSVELAVGVYRVWAQVVASGQTFIEDTGALVIQ